ncbi:hypothetical protein Q428_14640 [Fervidicella metallireducens AeB]|uniref:Transposase n=1 Tax=Fervidicella metallireducens AeB TaxID=1403537 RepID=A0A017RRW6_9CLOT|nr:hypothetical protein [Fervidicella metallireducens]EYE87199.1 hypothetical protein Q428_14640 [Fervidicella metallireducens AeB]
MQEIRQRQNNLNWDELIQNFQESGLSAPKWCKENGIKLSQLRWQLKKRKTFNNEEIQWVQLKETPVSISNSITVKIGNAEVVVSEGFNVELFSAVAKTLSSLC